MNITISQFRREVKTTWPHVTVKIKTTSFADLARADKKCLTVSGDKAGELVHINALAKQAGILPDGNIRCFPAQPEIAVGKSAVLTHKDGSTTSVKITLVDDAGARCVWSRGIASYCSDWVPRSEFSRLQVFPDGCNFLEVG